MNKLSYTEKSNYREEGAKAYQEGLNKTANPYSDLQLDKKHLWNEGFADAKEKSKNTSK